MTENELAAPAPLPPARGQLTERLFARLRGRRTIPEAESGELVDEAGGDDAELALYCCYELHYGSFADVSDGCEWALDLLAMRAMLEARLEAELRAAVGPVATSSASVVQELRAMAADEGGPSLSRWIAAHGTVDHLRELAKHRSAYQLKEADPHTWAIPRLRGEAKAVMTAIQADEYGNGDTQEMHASLYVRTMTALGLDPAPNAYLGELPALALRTSNLISWLGLHRRLRGALVGHLALFEMTSVGPMARYAQALERLGVPPEGCRFYTAHVEADRRHEKLAIEGMVAGLLRDEPGLAGDVVFGARALKATEAEFASGLLGSWQSGRSSLLAACPNPW